ncbi:MAG: long-chain fatty acid--CoA ligase [Acidobacteriota bacterium]|nr:MAG: long-chain fatty acid--CoA ligase [Acidobacteriota bacterium]
MKYGPAYQIYPVETLRELLFKATDRYSDRKALMGKRDGKYQGFSYGGLRRRIEAVGTVLLSRGLKKGDRVGLVGENRPEWAVSYLGIVSAGLVAVPIDKDLNEREIKHILSYAEVRVLIASADYLRLLVDDRASIPSLEVIISMEDDCQGADLDFPTVLETGTSEVEAGNHQFSDLTVKPDDLAVLIFTSGTTGASKGVMLTHQNVASNVMGTSHHVAISMHDIVLSVLPLHHTYEATAGFLTALYQGATICYAESLRRIADNLRETRASVLLGVPALFEAMFRRIEAGIAEKGKGKFALAKGLASLSEKVLRVNVRRKIFRELHAKFGGSLRLMISGGAAINPSVSKGYRELGINFIQGYGMTENSPIISVNRVDAFKDDSVGLPLPNAEVKIVDDEIVVRGSSVMLGYYKNPAATEEALRDGWLYTGDLGYFDRDGFLHVNGRRKSVIVTPNGKNVYPEEIESILNQSPFVLESLVWGGPESDPSLTEVQAIIVPDTEHFDKVFGAASYDEEKILNVISQEVKTVNRELSGFKRIKKFVIRGEEFEKTTTRKIKRYLYTTKTTPLKRRLFS